jgi:hypothetical protein
MVVIYIQGGQLARSLEISSIKVKNNIISSRNIFVINGRVAIIIIYDKSQKHRGKIKYIFRYFPDQLS